MGGWMRTRVGLAVVLALCLGACGGSAHTAAPPATVPRATTTTAPADPYAIPAVIDANYLNRVFVALDHIDGDAARIIVSNWRLVPPATDRMAAIYFTSEFTAQTNLWLDLLDQPNRFKPQVGDRKTTTRRIITARQSCVFAEIERDYTAITVDAKPPSASYVAMKASAPSQLNPTPWKIDFVGTRSDGAQPGDPCA